MNDKAKAAEENLKKLFKENPDIAKAFKETIEEMRKPENIKKMANEIDKGFKFVKRFLDQKETLNK